MASSTTYTINVKSRGVKKTNRDVNKLKSSMGGLNKAITGLVIGFGAYKLGGAIINLGKSSIQTAGDFETLRIRLNNMYGSVQKGGEAFDAFNEIAATTPFQLKNVVEAGASLKAFGVDAENMIKPVSDLAAFMGLDVVDAANAMGRAFAGGAGAADVLRDRGILQLIKDSQGIEDLTKLTIPEFRDVMVKALTDPSTGIVGATDALSKSWQGTVSNFQDGIDRIKAAIGKKLIEKIQPLIEDINAEFGKMGELGWDIIGESILENWKEIFKGLGTIALAAGTAMGKSVLIGFKNAIITGWAEGVGSPIAGALNKIRDFGPFQEFREWFGEDFFPDPFPEGGQKRYEKEVSESNKAIMDEFLKVADTTKEEVNNIITTVMETGKQISQELFPDIPSPLIDFPELFDEEFKIPLGIAAPDDEGIEEIKAMILEELDLRDMALELPEPEISPAARLNEIKKVAEYQHSAALQNKKDTLDQIALDQLAHKEKIKSAVEGAQTARQGVINAIRGQIMEATSGLIAKYLSTLPPWLSLPLAAGAGGLVNELITSVVNSLPNPSLKSFATGGSFVTNGAEPIMVGDNPSGRELVSVTPLDASGQPTSTAGGVNITFTGNVMSQDFIENEAIPQIRDAIRRGASLGVS